MQISIIVNNVGSTCIAQVDQTAGAPDEPIDLSNEVMGEGPDHLSAVVDLLQRLTAR